MNKLLTKFALFTAFTVMLAGNSEAAKWKELVFTDDINSGLAELTQYCMLHDVTVADVLWANSVNSADIKPGQTLYLPANHADMLSIWQHKGAWQPTALVPVTSAAAAKRASKKGSQLKEVPMPKIAGIPDLQPTPTQPVKLEPVKPVEPQPVTPEPVKTAEPAPVTPEPVAPEPAESEPATVEREVSVDVAGNQEEKSNDDIIAMLREEVRTDARNLPPETHETHEKPAETPEVQPAKTEPAVQPEPVQPVQPVKTDKTDKTDKKTESPAKVISNTAKADRVLTSSRKKSSKPEIPGLMDPIIIFSPNGDPSKGPMRLVISGDKVEVVQLPKSAAPKRPSLSDLNNSFGTNPSYLPHYNLTPKKRDPFVLNMGNLRGKMLWPVDGKVSSPFGKWRGNHKHQGIDIPMPAGTPIRAARNGVVTRTGNNSTMGFRGYGNFVLMDHGEGVQTFYAHCLSVAVAQGQRVMQGQIIGYVGSTGRSTANHLHFEVRVNNAKVDPVPYLAGNTSLASNK